jgi:hypothetical protein
MSLTAIREEEITRLKDILFADERRLLHDLRALVLAHEGRIGTDERLSQSVAAILIDSLKAAGGSDAQRIANLLAPSIVKLVRREIANSRDDLIEALYPLIGRLISAYLAKGFHNFIDRTDRRLSFALSPGNLLLAFKSALTGVPLAELRLKAKDNFRVEEILLIRRGAGTVVEQWRSRAKSAERASGEADGAAVAPPGKAMVASLLSAVSDFAKEALADENGELRALDVGSARIFVRFTPAHIVALRCVGRPNLALEKCLDAEIVAAMAEFAQVTKVGGEPSGARGGTFIPNLARRLNGALLSAAIAEKRKGRLPLYALGVITLMFGSIGSLGGYHIVSQIRAEAMERSVNQVIASQSALAGYPIRAEVSGGGKVVALTGIAPSQAAVDNLVGALQQQLGVVPAVTQIVYGLTTQTVGSTLQAVSNITGKVTDTAVSVLRGTGQTVTEVGHLAGTTVKAVGTTVTRAEQLTGTLVQNVGGTVGTALDEVLPSKNGKNGIVSRLGPLLKSTTSYRVDGACGGGSCAKQNIAELNFDSLGAGSDFGEDNLNRIDWSKGAPIARPGPLLGPSPILGSLSPLVRGVTGPLGLQPGQGVAGAGGGLIGNTVSPVLSTLSGGQSGAIGGSGGSGGIVPAAGGLVKGVLSTPGRLLGRK